MIRNICITAVPFISKWMSCDSVVSCSVHSWRQNPVEGTVMTYWYELHYNTTKSGIWFSINIHKMTIQFAVWKLLRELWNLDFVSLKESVAFITATMKMLIEKVILIEKIELMSSKSIYINNIDANYFPEFLIPTFTLWFKQN